MSKPNRRRVRMHEFQAQVAEQVLPPDGDVEVELDSGDSIVFHIPLFDDPDDERAQALKAAAEAAQGPDELAIAILGDEQWDVFQAAGYTGQDFALLFASESQAAKERMGKFRYQPSGR